MNILLTNYFEEIRLGKYKYDLLFKDLKKNPKKYFNNTLINSPYEYYYDNKNITSMNISDLDPFSIFNENSIRNIGLVNRFLLRPAYEALKTKLEATINNSIDTFKMIYIILLSVFLAIILLFYLFVWIPFENALNTTVNNYNVLILNSFFIIFIFNFLDI